jgi:hypothetical protein
MKYSFKNTIQHYIIQYNLISKYQSLQPCDCGHFALACLCFALCTVTCSKPSSESGAQGRLFDFDFESSRCALTAVEGVERSNPIHLSV